jgi:hypothetical protein
MALKLLSLIWLAWESRAALGTTDAALDRTGSQADLRIVVHAHKSHWTSPIDDVSPKIINRSFIH